MEPDIHAERVHYLLQGCSQSLLCHLWLFMTPLGHSCIQHKDCFCCTILSLISSLNACAGTSVAYVAQLRYFCILPDELASLTQGSPCARSHAAEAGLLSFHAESVSCCMHAHQPSTGVSSLSATSFVNCLVACL